MLRADHPNEWKHLENVIDFFQALCLLFWRHVLDVSERQQRARDFLEEFRLLVGNAPVPTIEGLWSAAEGYALTMAGVRA